MAMTTITVEAVTTKLTMAMTAKAARTDNNHLKAAAEEMAVASSDNCDGNEDSNNDSNGNNNQLKTAAKETTEAVMVMVMVTTTAIATVTGTACRGSTHREIPSAVRKKQG